jgi:hypothetical protein
MINSFEQLPPDKRKRAIADALSQLRKTREAIESEDPSILVGEGGTNRPPELSAELQQRVTKIGLQQFYSESSAQTKAELAPVLEEMQRLMENGRYLPRERLRDRP